MPDADTVWLTPLDGMARSLEQAGLVVTWQEDHSHAHRATAQALADDSPAVRQIVACQLLAEPRPEAPPEQARTELFGPLAPELTRQLLSGQVSSEPGKPRAGSSGS